MHYFDLVRQRQETRAQEETRGDKGETRGDKGRQGETRGDKGRQGETRGDKTLGKAVTPSNTKADTLRKH